MDPASFDAILYVGGHGAKHMRVGNFAANTVVDGRLVTGQNPASAVGVGEAMVKLLAR